MDDWTITLPWNNKHHDKRCTPLIAAILKKDVGLVEALLKAGANPTDERFCGIVPLPSPLELAIRLENREIIALLIKYGAKP
jgi:ankyrin repeat protein